MNHFAVKAAGAAARERNKAPCLFLKKLHLEIREIVYDHLLGGKHCRRVEDVKSSNYYRCETNYINGPDHYYKYHTAILAVCRQVNTEAAQIFARRNLFVRINTDSTVLRIEERWRRIPIVVHDDKSRVFPHAAMTIEIERVRDPRFSYAPLLSSIVHIQDMPLVCKELSDKNDIHKSVSQSLRFDISIHSDIVGGNADVEAGAHHGSVLVRAMEPLRHLYGFTDADITGLENAAYKADILACISRDNSSPGFEETVEATSRALEEGDKRRGGEPALSLIQYEAASDILRSGSFTNADPALEKGFYAGWNPSRVRTDLYVRISTRIATTYLALGHNRMARIYVERACRNVLNPGPEYDWIWYSKVLFWINPETDASSASYAGAAAVAAQISTEHGDLYEARKMLEEACRLDPKKKLYQKAHDWTREELQESVEKQGKRKQIYASSICARVSGFVENAEQREQKGDEAFDKRTFNKARRHYEASSARLEAANCVLEDDHIKWQGDSPRKGPYNMSLHGIVWIPLPRVRAKMTTVCLELQAYSDVLSWARSLVGSGEYYWPYYEHHGVDRPAHPENVYCAKAYYNKALACEAIGLLNQAVLAILNAADYGAEDAVISSQLAVLKKAHKEMKERKKATKRARRAAKDAKLKATADDAGDIIDFSQLPVSDKVHKEQSKSETAVRRAKNLECVAKDVEVDPSLEVDPCDICSTCLPPMQRVVYTPQPGFTLVRWV